MGMTGSRTSGSCMWASSLQRSLAPRCRDRKLASECDGKVEIAQRLGIQRAIRVPRHRGQEQVKDYDIDELRTLAAL
jgi:hypothetical protein